MDKGEKIRNNHVDGYIEVDVNLEPVEKLLKRDSNGNVKEWLCVESHVFKKLLNERTYVETKHQHNELPIMELKKRKEDDNIRKTISKNLDEAISKRVKMGNKTDYMQRIADDFGYQSIRALQNAKGSANTPLHAEDILYFEKELGIHRDEILGDVALKQYMYNISGFRVLFAKMQKDPEITKPVSDVLLALNNVLSNTVLWESEECCNEIKLYLKSLLEEKQKGK